MLQKASDGPLQDEAPECWYVSAGGGLTAADIDALSQPIPDKFWSKIGRRMSNQRSGKMPPQPVRLQQNWFHNDEGTVVPEGGLPPPAATRRRSFNYDVSADRCGLCPRGVPGTQVLGS